MGGTSKSKSTRWWCTLYSSPSSVNEFQEAKSAVTYVAISTACGHRMAYRKWKETKQQLSLLPGPAVPGCSLVSFHFLFMYNFWWAICGKWNVKFCMRLGVTHEFYFSKNLPRYLRYLLALGSRLNYPIYSSHNEFVTYLLLPLPDFLTPLSANSCNLPY